MSHYRAGCAVSSLVLIASVVVPAVGQMTVRGQAEPAPANGAGSLSRTIRAQLEHPHHREKLLVRFRPGVSNERRREAHRQAGATEIKRFRGVKGLTLVQVRNGELPGALQQYDSNPNVDYAEPDYEVRAVEIPNDPAFDQLWGMHNLDDKDVDAPEAWDLWTGDSEFKIAVIDTGINYNHPDLQANIWTNPGEIPGNGIDDDGNGYVDDIHGYDFYNNDGDPFDDHRHGSHVAGTIGAVGNNGLGVVGLNWQCQIVGLKFLSSFGSGFTSDAIAAVQYTIDNDIRISNNSWGGGGYSQALYDVIQASHQLVGHIFVAAAGNSAVNTDTFAHYPSSYNLPNIISVAATDNNDNLASFSNYGLASVDLGAPGVNVYSTMLGSNYGSLSGTSMATPHVVGVVALVMSRSPTSTWQEVLDLILQNVRPVNSLAGITVTGGVVNAAQAVQALGDCNSNGIPDDQDIADGTSQDCNANGTPDECEPDCNGNAIADECDIAGGTSTDCNANNIPDECEADCNTNGVADDCDISGGTSKDCNTNAVPDECDLAAGASADCNANSIPDECDIADGPSTDCTPILHDCCETGHGAGCDDLAIQACVCANVPYCCEQVWDEYCRRAVDIFGCGTCVTGSNGVPDECEADCNANSIADSCELADASNDCNGNGVLDDCDIASGTSDDCNADTVPDECQFWLEQDKLGPAEDRVEGIGFGYSVSIRGRTAVVGAYLDESSPGVFSGAAYVFEWNGTAWVEQARLIPPNAASMDQFGVSVAVSEDTILVGAGGYGGVGSVYVFRRSGWNWVEETRLIAPNAPQTDYFGYSVDISGDTAVVGAIYGGNAGTFSGAAYVFRRSGTSWSQQAKLSDPDAGLDNFGNSVAVAGDVIAVGAPEDDQVASSAGACHVYRFDGIGWVREAKLSAPSAAAFEYFGSAVDLSGDTLAVGAPGGSSSGVGDTSGKNTDISNTGAVYVWRSDGAGWNLESQLSGPQIEGIGFGHSVAISEDTIVAAPEGYKPGLSPAGTGAASVFRRVAATWTHQADLVPSDQTADTLIANSVDIDEGRVIMGTEGYGPIARTENAYVFVDRDCNANGVIDECDIAGGGSPDLNGNGRPDECDECLADADCDDGDPCTVDSCNAGICVGIALTCEDGDACTVDRCDAAAGVCVYDPISCDDGNACTADTCDRAGGCVNTIITCDDGDLCTLDGCDSAFGCFSTPRDCSDGNVCTDDLCDPAFGCANVAIDCDDADLCTTDWCDPALGGCVHATISCSDADACTTDSCDPIVGCVNDPVDCDDANTCTFDGCDRVSGCVYELIDCDDLDACTADACDPATGLCSNDPIGCDDADACTTDGCDPAVGCFNDPVDCEDGDLCTLDTCDPSSGCASTPIPDCTCDNDGVCELGEGCNSCPSDCFESFGAHCGNGLCEAGDGEDCLSCPQDCNGKQTGKPSRRFCCGDGDGQNPVSCSDARCTSDGYACTDAPAVPSCCGDEVCEGTENSLNCEVDCGPLPCGDGICDAGAGEDQCICQADCGIPPLTETSCTDGEDEDCDSLVDCSDPDCDLDPDCSCGAVSEACTSDSDCCSGKCRGPAKRRTCRE